LFMKSTRRDFLVGTFAIFSSRNLLAGDNKDINLYNKSGNKILNAALFDTKFWNGADVTTYKDRIYDMSRTKWIDDAYLTYISGQGGESFTHEQVVHTVLTHQVHLPEHMSGAVLSTFLKNGVDKRTGVAFTDLYFVGDFDFFYSDYFQRMYRFDLPDGRTACAFECLKKEHVSDKDWKYYNEVRTKELARIKPKLRWMFGEILPMQEIFGMYLVEKGTDFKTRVSLIAKVKFGGDSWIASFGTKIPYVLRMGMESGFDACVAVARNIKNGNYPLPK
jgi:hypothetical protein